MMKFFILFLLGFVSSESFSANVRIEFDRLVFSDKTSSTDFGVDSALSTAVGTTAVRWNFYSCYKRGDLARPYRAQLKVKTIIRKKELILVDLDQSVRRARAKARAKTGLRICRTRGYLEGEVEVFDRKTSRRFQSKFLAQIVGKRVRVDTGISRGYADSQKFDLLALERP